MQVFTLTTNHILAKDTTINLDATDLSEYPDVHIFKMVASTDDEAIEAKTPEVIHKQSIAARSVQKIADGIGEQHTKYITVSAFAGNTVVYSVPEFKETISEKFLNNEATVVGVLNLEIRGLARRVYWEIVPIKK